MTTAHPTASRVPARTAAADGVRLRFADTGRARGPAVRRALSDAPAEPVNPFSVTALRWQSEAAAAETLRPLRAVLLFVAWATLVLAATATVTSLARIDRAIEIEERV